MRWIIFFNLFICFSPSSFLFWLKIMINIYLRPDSLLAILCRLLLIFLVRYFNYFDQFHTDTYMCNFSFHLTNTYFNFEWWLCVCVWCACVGSVYEGRRDEGGDRFFRSSHREISSLFFLFNYLLRFQIRNKLKLINWFNLICNVIAIALDEGFSVSVYFFFIIFSLI